MQFPVSYSTFTIPNGAAPGTSRTVLYPNGALISYGYPAGVYVALFQGQVFLGPTQVGTGTGEADFAHAGIIRYNNGPPALLIISSPPTSALPNTANIEMVSGSSSAHAKFQMFAGGGGGCDVVITADTYITGAIDLFGTVQMNGNPFLSDVYAPNIQAGNVNITTVANQWVQEVVTFTTPFTGGAGNNPTVIVTGQGSAPAAGGSTALQYAVTGVSNTQFTLCVLRATTITMSIGFIAIYNPVY